MADFSSKWVQVLVILVGCLCFVHVGAVPVEEDLTITYQEKVALDKLRSRVSPYLPNDYMNQDIYLIKFLRARHNSVRLAEIMIYQNLAWRRALRLDTILTEDWSDMEKMFPYTRDTFDKDGRPIATITFKRWNIRRALLQGKLPRFLRYLNKLLEHITQDVYRDQLSGKNVTQWKVLYNLEGFNVIQHACPLCLPTYLAFIRGYEEHYPGMADQIIMVNTPPAFHIVLNLVRPLFSSSTRRAVKIFGVNKQVWTDYLDSEISRSERRPEFGGTKEDSYLTKEIRVHPSQGNNGGKKKVAAAKPVINSSNDIGKSNNNNSGSTSNASKNNENIMSKNVNRIHKAAGITDVKDNTKVEVKKEARADVPAPAAVEKV